MRVQEAMCQQKPQIGCGFVCRRSVDGHLKFATEQGKGWCGTTLLESFIHGFS